MRRFLVIPFLAGLALVSGCATSTSSVRDTIWAGIVAWPKVGDRCDFERTDRDAAIIISTTRQNVVGTRRSLDAGQTYVVRDAQLIRPMHVGETLCASVVRNRDMHHYDAVYGFEMTAGADGFLDLAPIYARRGSVSGSVEVKMAIGVAEVVGGELRSADLARVDFGAVTSRPVTITNSSSSGLVVPDGWVRRFAVMITEGHGTPVSDEDILRTLGETDTWDVAD
jgi:hypothetical protein